MAFLIKADLTSIIYLEDIDVITEGDDTKVDAAIAAAIAEAKGYLDHYDIDALFARSGIERDPILFESCKAIACWFLTKACNANQDLKEIKEGAAEARTWLNRVQSGRLKQRSWPVVSPPEESTFFHVSSNTKRGNHY